MKRYQLVNAEAWEQNICLVVFESDDVSTVEDLEAKVQAKLGQPFEVIDAFDSNTHFPPDATPRFKTEQEISRWLARAESS